MVSVKEARLLFLYEYKLGHTAGEAEDNINAAFGKGATNYKIVQRWFKKFQSGNENIENEPRERPDSIISEDQIKEMLEETLNINLEEELKKRLQNVQSATVKNLASDLGVSPMTVSRHLAAAKKVKFTISRYERFSTVFCI